MKRYNMSDNIKGIPIKSIIDKYNELHNVWKVGEFYGISGQTIHNRLNAIGVIHNMNYFSTKDKDILKEKYIDYKERGLLQNLADELGRTKQFICRKAKELGLTGRVKKYNFSKEKHLLLSNSAKNRIKKYGHPKGALGLTHSTESKEKISNALKNSWQNNRDLWRNSEKRKLRSDHMMNMQESGKLGARSRGYITLVEVGNKYFTVKSSWEYNIALYLEYLKTNGLITNWEYESKKFVFKYNTLGVRSYKPDFTVTRGDRIYYIEVKGWEDKKYEVKRSLMEKEYPEERVIYIKDKEYHKIERKYADKLQLWDKVKDIAGKKPDICMIEECTNPVHSKGLCRHHFYQIYHK